MRVDVLFGVQQLTPQDVQGRVVAVIDVLRRFSQLCVDVQDVVQEIDLNPLIVRPVGQGACAVDSLFVLDR